MGVRMTAEEVATAMQRANLFGCQKRGFADAVGCDEKMPAPAVRFQQLGDVPGTGAAIIESEQQAVVVCSRAVGDNRGDGLEVLLELLRRQFVACRAWAGKAAEIVIPGRNDVVIEQRDRH